MSALEVLQSCPLQRKALLSALGVNDDDSSSVKDNSVVLQLQTSHKECGPNPRQLKSFGQLRH